MVLKRPLANGSSAAVSDEVLPFASSVRICISRSESTEQPHRFGFCAVRVAAFAWHLDDRLSPIRSRPDLVDGLAGDLVQISICLQRKCWQGHPAIDRQTNR